MVRKSILLTLFLCFFAGFLFGQLWPGYFTDNYAGVNSTYVQPASIVSSPYKLDINFVGFNVSAVSSEYFNGFVDLVQKDPLELALNSTKFIAVGSLQLPSFMLRLDDKNAIGLDMKFRSIYTAESSDENVFKVIEEEHDNPSEGGYVVNDAYFNARTNIWWDIGLTYARNLISKDKHNWTMGLTTKLINAKVGAYIHVDDLSFQMLNGNSELTDLKGKLAFVYNNDLDGVTKGQNITYSIYTTVGLSVGSEYYYSPNPDRYKLKFGLSVLDIGRMKFARSENSVDLNVDLDYLDLNTFYGVKSLNSFSDTLENKMSGVSFNEQETFYVSLPTRLGFQADYYIARNFYLNFSTFIALTDPARSVDRVKNWNRYYLTPRLENEKIGVGLPVSYNEVSDLNIGFYFRWGPLYFGSDNLLYSLVQGGEVKGMNAFFGIKFHKLRFFAEEEIEIPEK